MTTSELMTMLKKNGIQLRIVDGKLAVSKIKGEQIPPQLLIALKEKKGEIIELLELRKRYQRFSAIEPVEEKEYYPVSSPQRRLFVLQQMQPGNLSYNSTQTILLPNHLDISRVKASFNQLSLRHESLRTSFLMVGDEPVQRIHKYAPVEVEVYDFAAPGVPPWMSEREDTEIYGDFILDDVTRAFVRPFDIGCPPLIRVGVLIVDRLQSILLVDFHHIIADGTSLALLGKEFSKLYEGQRLKPLTLQYKDYSQWLYHFRQSFRYQEQRDFWCGEFSSNLPVLNLPIDFPRSKTQEFDGKVVGFAVSDAEARSLKKLALESGATMFILLLSIFNVLLSRLCGQEDIVVGIPVAARRHSDLDSIIGMFVNTLALRNFPRGDISFRQFLKEVKERSIPAFENQEFQFADLVERIPVNRDTARNPVFDVMFNLLNQMEYRLQVDNDILNDEVLVHRDGTAKFDLNLTAIEIKNGLYFDLEYSVRLFLPQTIERFIGYFLQLVAKLPNEPDCCLEKIDMIPGDEKQLILDTFNTTRVDSYPTHRTIHDVFSEQAIRTPGRVALVSRAPGAGHFTYSYLDCQSGILASKLRENGVGPGTVTAVMMERSLSMMVTIFGILKCGSCYLPIDPKYPKKRILFMLEDSRACLLISHGAFMSRNIRTIRVEEGAPFAGAIEPVPLAPMNSGQCAYAIYTSGSTGRPKGVLVEHRSVINRLWWVNEVYSLNEEDVWLQKTTITFDVSVVELFGWAFWGGRLALLEPGGEKEPARIIDALRCRRVSLIHFVPSMLAAFLDYISSSGIKARFSSLRRVFCSGEPLLPSHVEAFYKIVGEQNDVRLSNLYGPTESCVDVSFFDCPVDFDRETVPIGKPISNIRLFILDRSQAPLPLGVAGELHIAGEGVARGYLNRPTLTQERFVTVPSLSSGRMYRTGDLCRWLPDGNIEFLGRMDQQVKIRGFRIELGEIENIMMQCPDISQVVVIPVGNGQDDDQAKLCAFFVAVLGLKTDNLRVFLAQQLPEHMIPSHFVQIDGIPLTPNGKVDKQTLQGMGFLQGNSGIGYRPPSTRLEFKLLDIWAEALKIDAAIIGMDDRFFDLGGHSLIAIQVVAAVNREGFDISLGDLFENQTISTLAGFISGARPSSGAVAGASDVSVAVSMGIPSNPGFEPDVYATYFPCSYGAIREKIRYEQDIDIPKGLFLAANGNPIPALGYKTGGGIQDKVNYLNVDYPKLLGFREVGDVIGFSTKRRQFPSLAEALEYCREEIRQDHIVMVTGTTYFLNYTPDYRIDQKSWLKKMDGILQSYNESQKGKLQGHVFLLVDMGKDKYLVCDCTFNYFGVVSPEDFALAFHGNSAIEMSRGHKSFEAYPRFQVVELSTRLQGQQSFQEMLLNSCREIIDVLIHSKVLRSRQNEDEYVAFLGLGVLEELGRIIHHVLDVSGQCADLAFYCCEMVNGLKYKYIYLRDIVLDLKNYFSLPEKIVSGLEAAIVEWDSQYRALQNNRPSRESLIRLEKKLGDLYPEHLRLFRDIDNAIRDKRLP